MRHAYTVPDRVFASLNIQARADGPATMDCAAVAKLARYILRQAFPRVKFSVRTSRYSGGSSVDVRWTDGPTHAAAMALIDGLEGKGFDGMQDLAYYKAPITLNGVAVQTYCYLFGTREISPALEARAAAQVAAYFGVPVPPAEQWGRAIGPDGYHEWGQLIRRAAEDRTHFQPLVAA